ncbi:MAG: DUF2490 domain-containing protein [Chitinophagales bacterium]
MNKLLTLLLVSVACYLFSPKVNAQIDEDQLGAWYMYFWNTGFKNSPWGLQGDIQHRNWNLGGDLEQLLLRGGITYQPDNTPIKFTLGYGNITTGTFGDSKETTSESRIYQEALIPQKLGNRFQLTHRFRFEQRFVENQDFRTRWRYNLFLNVLLNKTEMEKGTIYFAFYNELFINGERGIGDGREVQIFDRNRRYTALGYCLQKGLNIQLGFMEQATDDWTKGQMQLSVHQKF